MILNGKTALVTGAGEGIGRGCAIQLAKSGADVILNDRLGSLEVAKTQEEILQLGRLCHVVHADVFTRVGCESLVSEIDEKNLVVDILVSNPAYGVRCGFLEFDPDTFEKIIGATLISGFHMSQLVGRQMVHQGQGGKIIFISSVQAEMPFANSIAYGAAKAGLNHMAQTISVELAQHKINVNVIEPGWIDTPGERRTFGEQTIQKEAENLPWRRLGTPADIGKAVAFLASGNADYITGAILCVDGGFRFKDCRSTHIIKPKDELDWQT